MNIKIRVATPDDVGPLRTLMKELVAFMHERFVEKRFEWGIQRRLYDPLQRHGLLIAEDIDVKDASGKVRPVGMIFAEIRVDPFGRSEGYIKQFVVTQDYREKGIGNQLLSEAIEHLKKIHVEKVMINVKEGQIQAAEELYKKFNFKEKYRVMEVVFNRD
jgi:ribosomal protein S18 acetylase RimI-like enzyme